MIEAMLELPILEFPEMLNQIILKIQVELQDTWPRKLFVN